MGQLSKFSSKALDKERRDAWSAAKLATRSYARAPTDSNASKAKFAWLRLRNVMAKTVEGRIRTKHWEPDRRNRT